MTSGFDSNGVKVHENGLKSFSFDDDTVMHQTSNMLVDLIPGEAYFIFGNERNISGRSGISYTWYHCPQIVDDERFEYIKNEFRYIPEVTHIARVRVVSNTNKQLVIEWLHNGEIETHFYDQVDGITYTAEQLN